MSQTETNQNSQTGVQVTTHGEPHFDKVTSQIYEKLKQSSHIYAIRKETENLAQYWKENYLLEEMIVDIKDHGYLTRRQAQTQEHPQNQKHKFEINLYPKFHTYAHFWSTDSKKLNHLLVLNFLSDPIKKCIAAQQWNFWKKQIAIKTVLRTYGPWSFSNQFKFGKPINQNYVSDATKFKIFHLKHGESTENKEKDAKIFYFEIKGYKNRLRRDIAGERGIYNDKNMLKYQDICQMGFSSKKYDFARPNQTSSYFKAAIGTSLYSQALYCKLKYFQQSYFTLIQDQLLLSLQSKFSYVNGFNLDTVPQQLISRNQKKWIGERCTAAINLRANVFALKNQILSSLGIIPYNYGSVWVSDNYSKKSQGKKYFKNVKFEGQIGLGFKIYNQDLFVDIPLFRAQGNPYTPKFGIRFQF